MEALTNIENMLYGNEIFVPTYQRAYSWETDLKTNDSPKQVNVFLSDLMDYINSQSSSPYYFGHFLFENKGCRCYGIIDGQQRLTTITIFLAVLFKRLKTLRKFSEEETFAYQSMIKLGSKYRFKTVDYDNQLFKDYVVNQVKTEHNGLETESQKRIVAAFDYFTRELGNMTEDYIVKLLNAVKESSCTTHVVENEAEAIQMFIFQNNRGKKPSKLEIIKAQFMYHVHLYGEDNDTKTELIEEIKHRFENIYKSISTIEQKVNEDDVLVYTQRVFFNSLWENDAVQKVNEQLAKDNRLHFVREFTLALSASFEHLTYFFKMESKNIVLHSLKRIANFGIVVPFIIKAFKAKVSDKDLEALSIALEVIFIRARVIGTRADLTSRLNDVFQKFEGDVHPVIKRIDWMKTQEGWWGYWNNRELERALQGWIYPDTAKFLLWKYENHLIEEEGKAGYLPIRYDSIVSPQLEHIAPQTENPESGYCEYDEDFRNHYLDCLGNYLLLSAHHNISIGNVPFEQKRASYNQLHQQQEVRDMTEMDKCWDKEKISKRKEKIVQFLLGRF
ncbi:DUF262 domain-containing protein [Bacteroides clarus]|jgi:hypothetical protein|uniref:DUF262 domain-containing protein n=1 Tax=Bacteroides clarus TaxID=626929 RepID=UPI00189E9DA1|nr:DUF262 domain-containing protein [Bacteroides clarus]